MTERMKKAVGGRWSVIGGKPATGQNESGFTLLELIITLTIIAIMVAGTIPVAHNMIKREKEFELRRNLRQIRQAIDDYYDHRAEVPPFETKAEDRYPLSLQALVDGFEPVGKPNEYRRFLRRIPIDPFTGNTDWGLRSMEDDPYSTSGGGPSQSYGIWDVYSKAPGKALDGTFYSTW